MNVQLCPAQQRAFDELAAAYLIGEIDGTPAAYAYLRAASPPVRVGETAGMDGGRSARYQAAEAHPLIQAIRKRFTADIITREPITREEWLRRSQPGGAGTKGS